MIELIPKIFSLAMSPFTSGSEIVILACAFSFVLGLCYDGLRSHAPEVLICSRLLFL